MEELVNAVAARAGLSPDQARAAVQTVMGFIDERLPAPIAAQVSALLGGTSSGAAPPLGSIARGIEGMFDRPA